MLRRQQGAALFRRAHRGPKRLVGGVRFRGGGQINDGLRDREFAFGMAEEVVGVLGGVADHQRLRIGKTDILHRHADHAPGQKQRILASIHHAREIIQGGVGVGAAHRLMQRRNQVVVTVGGLVVDRRLALQDILQLLGVENSRPRARRARPLRPASARRGRRHRPSAPARRAPPHRAAAFLSSIASAWTYNFSIASGSSE